MITSSLLIFALILEYIYEPISDKGLNSMINTSFSVFKNLLNDIIAKTYIYLFFPIAVYIVVNFVIMVIGYFIHPFFSFLINLIILFYCLKPNQFSTCIDKLENIKKLEGLKNDKVFSRMMKSKKLTYENILSNVFYNSTRIVFSVLFFFILLGPAGSLSYLIIDSYINDSVFKIDVKSKKIFKNMLGIIEFVPIQLTVLSYALVGDFEICMRSYKSTKNKEGLYEYNKVLINNVGNDLINQSKDTIPYDNELSIYKNILSRSFLAWLSIIVLFIFGDFLI